jgi:hypothetical protein
MGVGADNIKGPRDRDQLDVFITAPSICFSGNFHSLVEIDPQAGEESITCDVMLDPGRSLKGKVLGPDGKPLAGARVSGLKDMGYWENDPLPGAGFTVESLTPNKSRLLQFMHKGKKLSGSLALRGDEKGPLQVRLQRWGTLTGRLVTPEGEPLTGVRVDCRTAVKRDGSITYEYSQQVPPAKDGRFRIEGLTSGLEYELSVAKGVYTLEIAGEKWKKLTIESGATKDLGELKVKPME